MIINPKIFIPLPPFLCLVVTTTLAAEPKPTLPEKHFTFLENYCLDCHDADTEKGKVNLEDLPFEISTIENAELWQKVLNSVNSKEMPPEDKTQPENVEKADFLDALANTMVAARKSLSDSGGKITMRRLNRREYQNTIKHLTGISIDVNSLPADGGSGSFDTEGASQYISSDQFEQYLKIGRKAIDELFERQATIGQETKTFRVEPETTVNVESRKVVAQLEKTYESYLLWKAEIDKIAFLPENEAALAKIREKHQIDDLTNNQRLYQNTSLLKGAPDATKFGFRDGKRASFFFQGSYDRTYAYRKHYLKLPASDRGTYLKVGWAIQRIDLAPKPKDVPPGTYKLRIRAGAVEGSDSSRHFIEVGHPQRVNQVPAGFSGAPLKSLQVTGTVENPQIIETTLEVGLDTPREFAIHERRPHKQKAVTNEFFRYKAENGYGTPPAIWVDWVELEGPLKNDDNSATTQDEWWITETNDSDESSRARKILEQFAFKANRNVAADKEFIDRLTNIFASRREVGDAFDTAIRLPMSIILASPAFLYLNEPNDTDERRQLNDRELAVRLAYFLWSAPPDQQLLDLAEQNKLSQPEVLRQQVDRLIADSRSDEFVSGFLHQWLDMERLDLFQFDTTLHREFDESTHAATRQEVYHSFAHLLRNPQEGQLGKLLKSDYVFVNPLLANYYDIKGVTGEQFQKVSLPEGSPRGGLLGMAAIHAMGSDGIESSPVERGVWVLRHLLHDPPPPAPPNVPQLSRLADKPLTTREKLAAHMEEAQCASCHRKIDPIGFGLENFDAAGKWRVEEGKGKTAHKIDPSGVFHNGPAFSDYYQMRDLIAGREDDFARGFVEHLIGYGLGRPFGFTDEDLADEIQVAAKEQNYTVSEFVQTLVQSKAFQTK